MITSNITKLVFIIISVITVAAFTSYRSIVTEVLRGRLASILEGISLAVRHLTKARRVTSFSEITDQ